MIIKKDKYSIINNNYKCLNKFLSENKNGLKKFRYFSKRTYEIINRHLCTYLYFENENCVGYGHLDIDGDKIWLGIMVSENFTGKGIGDHIVKDLISQTSKNIHLSVDKDNFNAIKLYHKNNFKILFTEQNYHVMLLKQKNE